MPRNFFASLFPSANHRNIAVFYFQTACISAFFCASIWLFFWTRFITLSEVGVIDWIAVIAAWFAEVPSGVLADRIGRKRLVVWAFLIAGVGTLLQGLASTWGTLLVSNILYLVGFSFHSGAAEALAYESLRDEPNQSEAYEKVIAHSNAISLVSSVVAIAIGALTYSYDPSLPYWLQAGVFFLGGFACLFASETRNAESNREHTTVRNTVLLSLGSLRLLDRKMLPAALVCFSALGLYDMCSWSFLRTAMASKFGYDYVGYSWILNIGLVLAVVATLNLPPIRHALGDRIGFTGVGAVFGVLFLACAFDIGVMGAPSIVAIIVLGNLLKPWLSVITNERVADQHRATIISLFAFLARVQFLMLGAVLPALAERGFLGLSLGVLGGIVVVCSAASWFLWERGKSGNGVTVTHLTR